MITLSGSEVIGFVLLVGGLGICSRRFSEFWALFTGVLLLVLGIVVLFVRIA